MLTPHPDKDTTCTSASECLPASVLAPNTETGTWRDGRTEGRPMLYQLREGGPSQQTYSGSIESDRSLQLKLIVQ
jgi:hypothetical protein